VAIDYLTLMQMPNADRRDLSVGEVTRTLKNLAKEVGCNVLLLAQLNRGVESRQNKRPLPSDFRDSGSIEQDADYIITLYRDAVYNEETEMGAIGEADWCKVRHGSTFRGFLNFKNGMWVDDLEQAYASEIYKRAIMPPQPTRRTRDV
jgi:replicative DNA helicase